MSSYIFRDRLEGNLYFGFSFIHGRISLSDLSISIGKLFIRIRDINKHRLYFSERYGYVKVFKIKNIALRIEIVNGH